MYTRDFSTGVLYSAVCREDDDDDNDNDDHDYDDEAYVRMRIWLRIV